jgi:hypothetical protein
LFLIVSMLRVEEKKKIARAPPCGVVFFSEPECSKVAALCGRAMREELARDGGAGAGAAVVVAVVLMQLLVVVVVVGLVRRADRGGGGSAGA